MSAQTMKDMRCDTVDVAAPVAFSLPHALFAAGLLETESLCHYVGLRKGVQEQWKSPDSTFWESLAAVGVTVEKLQERAERFDGLMLGTWLSNNRDVLFGSPLRICRDLEDTLMVLSRVNGRLFVPSREPQYSWDVLLKGVFYVRDLRFEGSSLEDEVWPQTLIQAERDQRACARSRPGAGGGGGYGMTHYG